MILPMSVNKKTLILVFTTLLCIGCVSNTESNDISISHTKNIGVHRLDTFSDKEIENNVSSLLYKIDKGSILIDVYSYYGHVFLIGIVDNIKGNKYKNLAKRVKGVRQVSAKWFPQGTDEITPDDLKLKVKNNLSSINELITVKMVGRNVVLLGIVKDAKNINKAVNSVKKIKRVKNVTNFLVLQRNP